VSKLMIQFVHTTIYWNAANVGVKHKSINQSSYPCSNTCKLST